MKNKVRNIPVKRVHGAAREAAYTALAVALITVCAWISLPIAEVPFTLQTFAVALVGGLLGWKRGMAAVSIYLLMGMIGIPVFAGFRAGIPALMGATGGYIFGFLFAALLPALAKLLPIRNQWGRTAMFYLAMALGLAVCYVFGTVWFVTVYSAQTNAVSVGTAIALCVTPYLIPDAVKLAFAALLTVRLEPFIR